MQIIYNTSIRTKPIKYIVIHDTGNKSEGADALAHFNYFNTGNRNASADFFVDGKQSLKVNDYTKYYTWHCGDGNGKNGITNQNSVGVEICINADGDYEKAKQNALDTVRKLMKELDIPPDCVVRHYDASGKNCPQSFSESGWAEFKKALAGELTDIDEIVGELAARGIVTDSTGMIEEMKQNPDGRLYWLARKLLNELRQEELK